MATAVVGVGALHLAVVEPVGRHAARIHHRPVSHVDEEAVGIVLKILRLIAGRGKPHALGVSARAVTLLDRIAAAERHPAAAMGHLAAGVKVLVDDEDRGAEILGADGGDEAGRARAEDNDVGFVVPFDGIDG